MSASAAGVGRWQRLTDRWTRPQEQVEADELREATAELGGTPICDLADRDIAQVCGTVRCVTVRPRGDVPALVAELDDGSRTLRLVWLGRRTIAGVAPGAYLFAKGRVSGCAGVPTIFNPAYELRSRPKA